MAKQIKAKHENPVSFGYADDVARCCANCRFARLDYDSCVCKNPAFYKAEEKVDKIRVRKLTCEVSYGNYVYVLDSGICSLFERDR